MLPDDGHFGIKIDFTRGQSDPVTIFTAMTELLRAFSEIDRQLIGLVAPDVHSSMVIEEVEAASITAWVKNALSKADDEAIKSMEVKKAIGVYLVKAKYRVIQFLDEMDEKRTTQRRQSLREDLSYLAQETEAGVLFPGQVNLPALEAPLNEIQRAKARLGPKESLVLKGEGLPDLNVNTAYSAPVDLSEPEDEPTDADGGSAEMLLLIRKPDLIGKSKWEFKHGKQTISAPIEDADWMARFHRGRVGSILPGSEMRARVKITYQRDAQGQIVGAEYGVTNVLEILAPRPDAQAALFPDEVG
jgi:hypothetical protein